MERFVRRMEWIKSLMAENELGWEDQYRAKVVKRERGWNKENDSEARGTRIAMQNSCSQ